MVPVERGFMRFDTVDEAMKYGQMIANSSFCPVAFKGKAGDVLVAIQFGLELGLAPMQALQNIAVINGRPSLYGDAMLAVCKAGADYESVEEWIEGEGELMQAVCKAKREGEPAHTVIFSAADARKANLWGKAGPWSSHPKRMLQMKARSFCLRDVFPHLLRGMVAVEEAQDYEVLKPKVVKCISPPPKEKTVATENMSDSVTPMQSLMGLVNCGKVPLDAIDEALGRLNVENISDIPEDKIDVVLDYWMKKYGDK